MNSLGRVSLGTVWSRIPVLCAGIGTKLPFDIHNSSASRGYRTLLSNETKCCMCGIPGQSLSAYNQNNKVQRNVLIRCFSSKTDNIMNVFDRKAKRIQRNRTAGLDNYEVYDYLKDEIGYRTADRISDVKRKFEVAVDLGCGRGHISQHIYRDMVGLLYQTDMAEMVLNQSKVSPEVPTIKVIADEEHLPFPNDSLDLVVSSLSLHWVNDLPGTFKQVFSALRNDGCFMGAMFGGDTLFEMRVSLQVAETEREGGIGAHVSPFTSAQDLGGLMQRAGFVLLTIDIDEIVVNYPSMFELMRDLQGMGENNCAWSRRSMIPRKTQEAAANVYKDMYGQDQEGIPATFQILNFIGWKPDPSQKPAAKRGSGDVSLKDIDKLDEMSRVLEKMKEESPSDQANDKTQKWDSGIDNLANNMEKLRQHTIKQQNQDEDKT